MDLVSPADFVKERLESVQAYALLSWQSITNLFSTPRYLADTLVQADLIGVGSLPITLMAGFFIGAAFALQSSSTMARFGSLSLMGQLVSLSMVKELGPVLTGLMVSGRNASGMASELGSMQVTEQIDAMRALGTDPTRKLVTPRVVATIGMVFILTILADFVGIVGGLAVSRALLGLDAHEYWSKAWQALVAGDIVMGLTKPIFFGFILATVGCYFGLSTKGGTQGVGRSTTQAVVVSSVLILVADLFITRVMMLIFGS